VGITTTGEQTARAIREEIARSDAIIDATVFRYRDGRVALKPIRVWKGERRDFYEIANDRCGIFLPAAGMKVRVLLIKLNDRSWLIMEPILDQSQSTRGFDRALDSQLRCPRPQDFRPIMLP
jgi:hypothetical protein